jgi:class 3 adenylate cyclase
MNIDQYYVNKRTRRTLKIHEHDHIVPLPDNLSPRSIVELTVRFGLHSGPCTAGVLRAERARYQIFGDTVNVAARMESTGEPGQIQICK